MTSEPVGRLRTYFTDTGEDWLRSPLIHFQDRTLGEISQYMRGDLNTRAVLVDSRCQVWAIWCGGLEDDFYVAESPYEYEDTALGPVTLPQALNFVNTGHIPQ